MTFEKFCDKFEELDISVTWTRRVGIVIKIFTNLINGNYGRIRKLQRYKG